MVTSVEKEILKKIKEIGESVTYSATSNLFYEGQIPVVAYLVLSGNIHLTKSKKVKSTIGPGSLIGIKELMHHTPVNHSAMIMPETEVCFLSRSDINEIIGASGDLSLAIHKLIAA